VNGNIDMNAMKLRFKAIRNQIECELKQASGLDKERLQRALFDLLSAERNINFWQHSKNLGK